MKFTAVLERTDGSATGIRVPETIVEALAAGRRPKVAVTLNGYAYRTSIAPRGGAYWIGVAAAHRAPAAVEPGRAYEVHVERDTAPRVVEVPEPLRSRLAEEPAAARAWASLSYSEQRRRADPIVTAKGADTRVRRAEKVLEELLLYPVVRLE